MVVSEYFAVLLLPCCTVIAIVYQLYSIRGNGRWPRAREKGGILKEKHFNLRTISVTLLSDSFSIALQFSSESK